MPMKVVARCQNCGQEFVSTPSPDSTMWLSKERGEYKCFKCEGTVIILEDAKSESALYVD